MLYSNFKEKLNAVLKEMDNGQNNANVVRTVLDALVVNARESGKEHIASALDRAYVLFTAGRIDEAKYIITGILAAL